MNSTVMQAVIASDDAGREDMECASKSLQRKRKEFNQNVIHSATQPPSGGK
jgi:hypothetical protein